MKKHEMGSVGDRINRDSSLLKSLLYSSSSLPNALIYSPIQDWRTDEVWIYLNQWQNPWGNNNKDLFSMYRGATADNECPLVIDTSTPSCGDSRFGCWVCTMVNQDKSMEAMIQNDEEKEWMQPLLDIRNELDIRNDYDRRDFRRIFGKVQLFERNVDGETSVEPIPGPYKKEWREHWLRRVLEAQTQVRQTAPPEMRDITLITHDELSEIRRIWLEEKHEFDDSLPRIYREVTGEPFNDPRPSAERKLLGSDEWTVLEEVCDDDFMHLELMAKLLDTEQQYHAKSRRGIYESLEKCFESSSRSKDEAIQNAHYQRNLKNAIQAVKDDSAELHEIREAFDENSSVSVAERLNKTSAKEDSTQQGKQLTLTGRVWEVSSPGASFIAGKPGNYAPAKQPGHEVTSNEAFAEPDRSAKDWASIKFSAQNSKEENE
jgi:DNA sulfur modification protein DndC